LIALMIALFSDFKWITPIERKRSIEAFSIQPFGPELTTEGLSAISLRPFD
jgi:hypothetical protein